MSSQLDMIKDIEEIYNFHSPEIFEALNKIPRDKFVPDKYRNIAFEDTAISIGKGQTISQPFTVAFMTYLLDLKGNEKVLEIGTGSGYQAAILSKIAKKVYTIERIEALAKKAKSVFEKLNLNNIYTKIGQGEKGWRKYAPFNAILITANTIKVPSSLFDQLKIEGRLVAPVGKGTTAIMTKYIKQKNKIVKKEFGSFSFVPLITS